MSVENWTRSLDKPGLAMPTDYDLREYYQAGLHDTGAVRVPAIDSLNARRWIEGQGGQIFDDRLTKSGRVIRYQDPSYKGIMKRLQENLFGSSKTASRFQDYNSIGYDPDQLSPEEYMRLQALKDKAAPPDFLDKVSRDIAAGNVYPTGNVQYTADGETLLRKAAKRLGRGIDTTSPENIRQTYVYEMRDPTRQRESQALAQYSDDDILGGKGRLYYAVDDELRGDILIPNQVRSGNLRDVQSEGLVRSHALDLVRADTDRLYDAGYTPQVIGTADVQSIKEAVANRPQMKYVQEHETLPFAYQDPTATRIHEPLTRFAIQKEILDEPNKRIAYNNMLNDLQTVMREKDYTPGIIQQYLSLPDLRNQIRSAGRFAGAALF